MVYHQCGAGSGCHHKITGIIGTVERKDTVAKDMNGQKIPEDKPPGFFLHVIYLALVMYFTLDAYLYHI